MTIQEAITAVDEQEPNMFRPEQKIIWLSRLDSQIWREVIATHEDKPETDFEGYTEATDPSTVLLVPAPDDEPIYINYLVAQINKGNREIGKYNQFITMFNDAMKLFRDYYNRIHTPVVKVTEFKF